MSDLHPLATPTVAAPPRRRKRRVLGVLAAVMLAVAAGLGYLFIATDGDLREAMAVADQDSPGGWEAEALEARRERVPDAENAALVVARVKGLLPANWPLQTAAPASAEPEDDDPENSSQRTWVERLLDLPPEVQLKPGQLRRLRACLAQVAPARAEARKLIGMTRGRFPLTWQDNVLEMKLQSPDARSAAQLLRFEAALAAHEGDADGAVAFVRGIVGAARSVGDEPLLLSVLIRLACDMQGVAALERALAQGEPSARELEAVQALLAQEAAEPLLVQALRGERAGMHKLLLALRAGTVDLSAAAHLGGPALRGGVQKRVLGLSGPVLARRSHAPMLALLNEYIAAAQLPPEDQAPVMNALEGKVKQAKVEYDIVTGLLMPAYFRGSEEHRRGVGNLRCAAVAVAVERYRRDQGRWPESLEALVPRYLAAVPTDPQDGKPLRYRRRADGIVVYWIGLDGTDDGGKLERKNYLTKGTDQGVQLWDVKRRRQTPPAAPAPGAGER